MANRNKPTIIITGANGFLGNNLVEHFSKKGWNVRALVRNTSKYTSSAHVSYLEYDLNKPLNDAVFKDAEYLVHTAYVKYTRQNSDALKVNVRAASRLIKSSRSHRLRKNVFISSMSAHDQAESVYAHQKLAIEKLFSNNKDVILRCGLLIGPGGIVKEMSNFMKTKHFVPLVSGGAQPLQVVAISDLVNVIDSVLTSNVSGIYTVASSNVYTYKEFYQALARQLKTKVVFVPIPLTLLIAMLDIISILPLSIGISKDNVLGLKKLKSVDTKGDLKRLGVKLSTLDDALKEI